MEKPIVSVDFETSGLDYNCRVASCQFYFPETQTGEFLPIEMQGMPAGIREKSLARVNEIISSHRLVGHSLGFDGLQAWKLFGQIPLDIYGDSYIFSLITQHRDNKLKEVIVSEGVVSEKEIVLLGNISDDFDFTKFQYDDPVAIGYALNDPRFAWLLEQHFRNKYPMHISVYEFECKNIQIFLDMKFHGMKIDYQGFLDYRVRFSQEQAKKKQVLNDMVGWDFRPNSSADLKKIVFDQFHMPEPPVRTKKGAVSMNMESLKYLSGNPFIDGLLEYKHIFSVGNTFAKMEDWITDLGTDNPRMHPTFKHVGADGTSRVYTQDPATNSLPREFRFYMIPDEGKKYIYCDWKGAELMLAAYWAGEQWLIDAYESGKDVHRALGSRIYGRTPESISDEERETVKIIEFSVIFGSEGAAASRALRIDIEVAQQLVARAWQALPKIQEMRDRMVREAKKTGYTKTIIGRRRRILKLFKAETMDSGERQVFNTAIQGSVADMQKMFLRRFYAVFGFGSEVRMANTVFDSFTFEVPEAFPMEEMHKFVVDNSHFEIKSSGFKGHLLASAHEGKTYGHASSSDKITESILSIFEEE